MSLISSESEVVTKENLAEFYQAIYPYLGGYDKGKLTYVGEIRMFYSETAPDGFLICDGSEYNKADYPELVNKLFSLTDTTPYVVDGDNTKFKVPDLRGEFLRGSGTNSHEGQGNGAGVGVHQDGTEIVNTYSESNGVVVHGNTSQPNNKDSEIQGSGYNYIDGRVAWNADISLSYTSRPTNTSVLFCIAYKTIVVDIDFLSYGSEKFAKSNMYDTNERVIGKWIDGRPLYQRTIYKENVPSGESVIDTTLTSDNTYIVNIGGFMKVNNEIIVSPDYSAGSNWYSEIKLSSSGLKFYCSKSGTMPVLCPTIQYTKTTDTADSFKYSTPNDYSTEEKIIGTWVDGKPLYQKTVYVEIPSSNYNEYSFCSDTDKVIYMNGYGYSSTYSETVTLPRVHTTANYNIEIRIVSGKLRVYANVSSGVSEAYVTLQYTKTTD